MHTNEKNQPNLFTDDLSIPVFRIELVRERTFTAPLALSPEDIAPGVCRYLERADREHFVVIMLATNCRIIGINTCHIGSLDSSVVSAREVFKPAILANAAKIVAAHNHPSGSLQPSTADIRVTRRLVEAGGLLGIPVLDSLIIGHDGEFASLAAKGIIRD